MTSSATTSEAAMVLGNGTVQDISVQFDGSTQDFYAGLDTTGAYMIGAGLVVGTTPYFSINSTGNIGIGLTTQTALLHLNGSNGTVGLEINSNATTGTNNIMMLRSDVASADDPVFRVQANGEVYADGAYTGTGADYAEYFFTQDEDLSFGEAVCIDEENSNAVRRCTRSGDTNIMGIISSNPSIIGNSPEGRENDENYKVVAMLGQIPAKVNDENGAVNIGDSLTASSEAGYLRRAEAGESTVGIALEKLISGSNEIKVLISRKNKSLTVEAVEASIQERIAAMEIEDQVNQIIANGTEMLEVKTRLNSLELANMGNGLLVNDINAQISQIKDQIKEIDFVAMNDKLDTLLSFLDATEGNIIVSGKLEAEITETGVLIIKNAPDLEAPTIGEAKICGLIPVDEDDDKTDDCSGNGIPFDGDKDGKDDATGKAMPKDEDGDWIDDDSKEGIVNNGRTVVIKTKAVNSGSKIFMTPKKSFITQPLVITKFDPSNGFTVEIKDAISETIKFDWWIVEEKIGEI
jgi:hypothetical protein